MVSLVRNVNRTDLGSDSAKEKTKKPPKIKKKPKGW